MGNSFLISLLNLRGFRKITEILSWLKNAVVKFVSMNHHLTFAYNTETDTKGHRTSLHICSHPPGGRVTAECI